jgi:hypothetical protein
MPPRPTVPQLPPQPTRPSAAGPGDLPREHAPRYCAPPSSYPTPGGRSCAADGRWRWQATGRSLRRSIPRRRVPTLVLVRRLLASGRPRNGAGWQQPPAGDPSCGGWSVPVHRVELSPRWPHAHRPGVIAGAGCTMVLKPRGPHLPTRYTALFFAQLLQEAGLPPGVLNAVQTSRAGAVTAPLITDSSPAQAAASPGRPRLWAPPSRMPRSRCGSMEPRRRLFLVFASIDIDRAVDGAMTPRCATG